MALSSMSTEATDDQRTTGCLMISKRSAPNPSQPVVVPVRPASRFHPTILSNFLSISSPPCTKMTSSYPAGPRPHYGHMFASTRSYRSTSNLGSTELPPTCTLHLSYPQPTGDCSLTVRPNQMPTNSPELWKRWTSLNCREMNSHVHSSVLRRTFSCNQEGTMYGCSFSPLFVHTVAFSTSMISGTRCNTSTVHGSTYPPCPDLAQDTTPSKASNDSLAFLETETDPSSHSKTNCLATEARVQDWIPTSIETGCTKDTDIESDPRNGSKDRKSFCGDYSEVEGDVESGVTYFFECDSESDDEIVFSNEPDNIADSVSCQGKIPSQCLMSLQSEESGFGEISYTESCDSEWDDDQQGSESGTDSDRILNTCDYHSRSFVPDPVPASSLKSSNTLVHSPTTCFQESAKYKFQSLLKHSQIMKRLSMSRVCAQRHRNCCLPSTHNHLRTTPCHQKKVSFLPDSELLKVHHIVVWNYAYQSCRKGPWEQYARDRAHFQCRIDRVRSIIEPCLQKKLKCMSAHSNH